MCVCVSVLFLPHKFIVNAFNILPYFGVLLCVDWPTRFKIRQCSFAQYLIYFVFGGWSGVHVQG